ncbi:MAG TPA: 4Fe-4S dicluster domain-containing protein [Dehalococcoidia bacterium]|nr:4Fe-4S dicluster domain-containing protein [Dehalococcoidia bacterium]
MASEDKVYRDLQKHLDKQAVGFPATKSGVELRILKHLFSPEQASLALHLNYKPQLALEVFKGVKGSGITLEKVKSLLEEMERNGAIGSTVKNGTVHYFTIPLLVGIVEWQSLGNKATPQFMTDFREYVSGEFGKAYASTKVSQMRTIPVEKSIQVEHHVTTYDHIREIINSTEGPIVVGPCVCREGAKQRGQSCRVTSRLETCMAFGDWARHFIKAGIFREITREEALEIIRQNEDDGLVLQPTNYQKIDFVCSCCGCCCGILTRQKMLPKPAENWSHNFHATVEIEMCNGCGICVEKCQMDAITLDEQTGYAAINLDRCIGCGNCVVTCPSEALKLVKMEKETVPPEDCTSLYELLAERK